MKERNHQLLLIKIARDIKSKCNAELLLEQPAMRSDIKKEQNMSQNYDDINIGRLKNNTKTNDNKDTNLSDSQFEKYGKVGGLMVKRMIESYETNLIGKS